MISGNDSIELSFIRNERDIEKCWWCIAKWPIWMCYLIFLWDCWLWKRQLHDLAWPCCWEINISWWRLLTISDSDTYVTHSHANILIFLKRFRFRSIQERFDNPAVYISTYGLLQIMCANWTPDISCKIQMQLQLHHAIWQRRWQALQLDTQFNSGSENSK